MLNSRFCCCFIKCRLLNKKCQNYGLLTLGSTISVTNNQCLRNNNRASIVWTVNLEILKQVQNDMEWVCELWVEQVQLISEWSVGRELLCGTFLSVQESTMLFAGKLLGVGMHNPHMINPLLSYGHPPPREGNIFCTGWKGRIAPLIIIVGLKAQPTNLKKVPHQRGWNL